MSWNPSSFRYSKNPFMANKNMSTQHRQDIINLWHQYKEDSYNPHSFYKNMFIEDVRAGILPIKLSRNKDSTKVINSYFHFAVLLLHLKGL